MRLITRFRQLNPAERGLFFRALAVVAIIRIGLRLFPYQFMVKRLEYFSKKPDRSITLDRRQIRQVAWAVEAASRRIPGASCLPQALATHFLLGRMGQSSQLQLGVSLNPGGQLEAHAWVEINGRVISGGAVEGFARYVPLQKQPS